MPLLFGMFVNNDCRSRPACLIKRYSLCFLKSVYSFHRWITRRRRSCPSFTAYLYAHKTIEHCTGAEKAGVELASKMDRISYTGKAGWEMPHQPWLIKTLPRLSQTKQDTTVWLPELYTAKTTTQETEKRLKGLYRYYSYVELNV